MAGSKNPLAIDISRLGRRPGSLMTYTETVPSPSRIGLELLAIEAGAPLTLDLQLQSVSEGVLVTGSVSGPTVGECSRCLAPISGDVEISLTELFAYPDSATEATTEEDEVGHVVDDFVNLEQSVVDEIAMTLPFSPVCTPDCPGLCPDCGVRLAETADHHHDKIDPRWAKLAAMMPTDDTVAPGNDS
ncbi:MAG: DUF177 domain-containing protein [Mycobacterium sp.]